MCLKMKSFSRFTREKTTQSHKSIPVKELHLSLPSRLFFSGRHPLVENRGFARG